MIKPRFESYEQKSYETENKLASLIATIISDVNVVVPNCSYSSIPYMLTQCDRSSYIKECDDGDSYCNFSLKLINETLLKELLVEQGYNYSVTLLNSSGDAIGTLKKGECNGSRFANRFFVATTEEGDPISINFIMCR